MNKDNFDFENEIPETPKTKYSDLDLGLDFDLSFLDDVDESVLDETAMAQEVPEEKPAPAKKAASVKKTAPVKKAADAAVPAKKSSPKLPSRKLHITVVETSASGVARFKSQAYH